MRLIVAYEIIETFRVERVDSDVDIVKRILLLVVEVGIGLLDIEVDVNSNSVFRQNSIVGDNCIAKMAI